MDIDAQIKALGYTYDDIEAMVYGSVVDGICSECGDVRNVEPDAQDYPCDDPDCGGKVDSVLIKIGIM